MRATLSGDDVLAPDHADGDQLDLAILEVIAVIEPVLLVKACDDFAQIAAVTLPAGSCARSSKPWP